MKNCICLASACLLILFARATSLAQAPSASPTPPGAMVACALCPTISVSCPSEIEVGKPLEFKASLSNPTAELIYTWKVTGAVIAEGQGTPTIRVNTVGRMADSVTATLRVDGLDKSCGDTASCSTGSPHSRWPRAENVDSYGAIPFSKAKSKLDLLADILKQNPGTQGYILGYGGRRSRAGEAQQAVARAKEYLITTLAINEDRIVTVDGGFKEHSLVDLWLVPSGANPPAASPTLDPTDVNLTKSTANKSTKRLREH